MAAGVRGRAVTAFQAVLLLVIAIKIFDYGREVLSIYRPATPAATSSHPAQLLQINTAEVPHDVKRRAQDLSQGVDFDFDEQEGYGSEQVVEEAGAAAHEQVVEEAGAAAHEEEWGDFQAAEADGTFEQLDLAETRVGRPAHWSTGGTGVAAVLQYFNEPPKLHLPCGTARACPAREETDSREYSSHRCVGAGLRTRSCVFYNVYFDVPSGRFEYYTRKGSPPRVVATSNHAEAYDFPAHDVTTPLHGRENVAFVQLEAGSERHISSWVGGKWYKPGWSIYKVQRSLPKPREVLHTAHGPHMLWEQKSPHSIGHLLIDNIFPMFVAMLNLNAFSPDMQLVLMAKCYTYATTRRKDGNSGGMLEECERLQAQYSMVVGKPPVYWEDLVGANTTGKLFFPQLLVGGGGYGLSLANSWCGKSDLNWYFPGLSVSQDENFRGARGTSTYWWLFRNLVMQRHGLHPHALPTQHQIVVLDKKGTTSGRQDRAQRRMTNIDELVAALQRDHPAAKVMKVDFRFLSLQQQLEVMSRTTVFITPSGSAGFRKVFLPNQATAITIAAPERGYAGKQTSNWEHDLWFSYMGHVKSITYTIKKKSEWRLYGSLKTAHVDRLTPIIMRNADIVVDIKRMKALVAQAVYEASLET